MSQDETQSVPALPSATIVMLRDSERGPEILMVKRRQGDAYGDSYTFPGGVVDANESDARALCEGRTADEADTILSVTGGGLDYYSAAIRELFEETSILLARDPGGDWPKYSAELQELRTKVDKADLAWSDFLHEQRLHIACDALHYFAYWETPRPLPKRWSTRFFMAAMPSEQDARHDGAELTDSRWLTATAALHCGRDGSMKIPHPTLKTLQELGEMNSVDTLIDWARSEARKGITKVCPVILTKDGKKRIVMPGDPDFPEQNEAG